MVPGAPRLHTRVGNQTEPFLRLHTWPRGRARGPGAARGRPRDCRKAGPASSAGRSLPGKGRGLFLASSFIWFAPLCGLAAGQGTRGAGQDQTHRALPSGGLRGGRQGKGEAGSDQDCGTRASHPPLPALRSHWSILSLRETWLDLHFKRMVWASVWKQAEGEREGEAWRRSAHAEEQGWQRAPGPGRPGEGARFPMRFKLELTRLAFLDEDTRETGVEDTSKHSDLRK